MTSTQNITIYSVEDNEVIRLCLRTFLNHVDGFNVVGEAADAESALDKIGAANPNVAIVDIGLPGMNGIQLTKRLKQQYKDIRVLILTASESAADIFESLDAGADGYVVKGDLSLNLEMAVRSVRLGAVWLDPAIARQVLQFSQKANQPEPKPHEPMPLSAEEKDVLNDVARSDCKDGVCLVNPDFVSKLKRFHSEMESPKSSATH